MKVLKTVAVILIVSIIFFVSGCSADSGDNIVFGTFYNIQLKGWSSRSVLKDIDDLLVEIEQEISTAVEGSDVYKINNASANEPIEIGNHTYELFKASMELYQLTDNAFNPAVFPLVELWSFSPDKFSFNIDTLPAHSDILSTMEYSKMEFFELDEENMTITKTHDLAKLDFGGIAKGYAIDLIKEMCKDLEQGLINIGGDILSYSRNANIGITHPREKGLFGVVKLNNLSISTSGDYERAYIIEDTRYSHIMDKNGHPSSINNYDIVASSVIGESAMYCDALATAIIVNGAEWTANNIEEMGYSALIIRINPFNNNTKSYNIIGDIDFEPSKTAYEEQNINS